MLFSGELDKQNVLLLKNIEAINDCIIFNMDDRGIIINWNKSAEKITGYTADEVIGQSIGRFHLSTIAHHPLEEILKKAKQEGFCKCVEDWQVHKNGTQFWSSTCISPVYDDNQQFICYVAVIRDLTHIKQEELLLQMDERYRLLTTVTSMMVWTRAPDGAFISKQNTWERVTGQSYEEYQGFGWLNMYHPDDRAMIREAWQKTVQEEKLLSVIARLWSKEHQDYRYVLIRSVPVRNDQNKIQEWIGIYADIHELKLAEEQLKHKTRQLNLALQATQAATWRWDHCSGQMLWDESMKALLGLDGQPVFYPMTFDEFIKCFVHPDDQPTAKAELEKAVAMMDSYKTELRILWPDQSQHYIAICGHIYRDEQAIRLIGMAWDITAAKLHEHGHYQALERAKFTEAERAKEAVEHQRKQSEFIDTICHEIRNPLNGIYGGAHLLNENLNVIEGALNTELNHLSVSTQNRIQRSLIDAKEALSAVDQCAQQQKILVDDVLDLSKLEANRIVLNQVPYNTKDVIERVAQMFLPQINEKKLKLSLLTKTANQWVKGDPHRLTQILSNLLSNAIKFTHEGSIIIKVKSQPRTQTDHLMMKFSVKDTGIGMSEDEISQLFDRFKQAHQNITSQYGGSGLGLSICKGLVEAMGGEIQVHSEKRQGSQFSFTIPCPMLTEQERLTATLSATSSVNQEPNVNITSKNILIVEDNVLNQTILKKYLEQAGHFCQIASNGQEAFEKYQQANFELIFMDIEMPILNGIESTKKIRQYEQERHMPETPICGLSGNVRAERIQEAKQAGMADYITKPYLKEAIYDQVKKCINFNNISLERVAKQAKKEKLPENVVNLSAKSPTFFSPPVNDKAMNIKVENINLSELAKKLAYLLPLNLPFKIDLAYKKITISLSPFEAKKNLGECHMCLFFLEQQIQSAFGAVSILTSSVQENSLIIETEDLNFAQKIVASLYKIKLVPSETETPLINFSLTK